MFESISEEPARVPGKRRLAWPIAKWTAAVCGAVVCVMFCAPSAHDYAERARLVLRVTGEASSLFFLATYVASPLHRVRPSAVSRWLVAKRRDLGVAFAAIQVYHAALLAALVLCLDGFAASRGVRDIGLGLIAYGFVFSMALTSFPRIRRRVDVRYWRMLHGAGMHYLWVGITCAYRTSGSYRYGPIAVMMAAGALRAWAFVGGAGGLRSMGRSLPADAHVVR